MHMNEKSVGKTYTLFLCAAHIILPILTRKLEGQEATIRIIVLEYFVGIVLDPDAG